MKNFEEAHVLMSSLLKLVHPPYPQVNKAGTPRKTQREAVFRIRAILVLTYPAPDPALFVSGFQDANKK